MKHDVTHTRPFDAVAAQAGAPYCCRDGSEATVLKWDCRDETWPLVGVYGKRDDSNEWRADGHHLDDDSTTTEYDLVLLPLGMLDGKPVFVGDTLISSDGCPDRAFVGIELSDGCAWRWPAPAKVYPVTGMTLQDFEEVYALAGCQADAMQGSVMRHGFTHIANAALRHAIDAGTVITKEDHLAALAHKHETSIECASKRAARDMAVAEAVNNWYVKNTRVHMTHQGLQAIIAEVK